MKGKNLLLKTLTKTFVTEEMAMIGSDEKTYTFRIEIFLDSKGQYSATLWRMFYCDVSVPPYPRELLFREMICSCEDSLGVDEISEPSDELVLQKVLSLLEERFEVI